MGLPQTSAEQPSSVEPALVQKAISRLQALPAFYPAVQKALHLLQDPQAANGHVEQVIRSDAATAARVLKLANSAYFGFSQRVSTVSLALSLLGRDKVATLLLRFLGEELLTMLDGRKAAAASIRQMSTATASAAKILAERMLRGDKEELVLGGLLHNVGELVLLSQFRPWYEETVRLAEQIPQAEAERVIFGVESRLVGKWLLEAWKFPPFFPAVIEHHADPWSPPSPAAPLSAIALVHAARLMAEAFRARRPPHLVLECFSSRLLGALEVDGDFLVDVYQHLPDEVGRLHSLLA